MINNIFIAVTDYFEGISCLVFAKLRLDVYMVIIRIHIKSSLFHLLSGTLVLIQYSKQLSLNNMYHLFSGAINSG